MDLTELRRRLARAVHESLGERIVVSYHFAGFGRDELPAYFIHRLKLAGCTLPLFEPPAILRLAFRHRPTLVHPVALSETTLSKPCELP